jgi:hypothetical protein
VTPEELIAGLRAGDRHEDGVRCLRLLRVAAGPFAALRGEVAALCAVGTPSDVRWPGHVTHWVLPFGTVLQFSLLNRSGRLDDFADDHHLDPRGKRFHDPTRYPQLARLVGLFPSAVNLRVNVLGRASGLSPHEEHAFVRGSGGCVVPRLRLHLPVETTERAVLILDGEVHRLEPGVIHLVNHGCVHAARNDADTPRVHVVWDVLLDRRTFELLLGDGPPPAPFARIPEPDRMPPPLRTERMGAHRQLPPALRREEVDCARLADDAQSSTPENVATT